jgi:hypothetical protein
MMVPLLLEACAAGVTIKNIRWYGVTQSDTVPWFETLSNASGVVQYQEFAVASPTGAWGCVDTNDQSEIKRELEQICSISGLCRYEVSK